MNQDTLVFSNKIHAINEADYGDFMRLGNSYLIELREQLDFLHDKNIDAKISEIQDYLQFRPDWNIKSTLKRLDGDIDYLDQILSGRKQEIESKS